MKKLYPFEFTIIQKPSPSGGLIVTVPEIGESVEIESTEFADACDAANGMVEKWALAQRPTVAQETRAS